MNALSNKALLTVLSIGQWTGRKQDKRAKATVVQQHKTDTNAVNASKKLLPGSRELEKIKAKEAEIRKFVYAQTLPWYTDGTRILASQNVEDFSKKFKQMRMEFESAVTDFLLEYPYLKALAQQSLGDLFSEEDYPTLERIEERFRCEIKYFPVPDVKDFRVQLADEEKAAFIEAQQEVEKQARQELYARMVDVVQTAVGTLADPKAIFRDSLIDNITKICDLVPKLDITDDKELEAARKQLRDLSNGISPDVLRVNPSEREKTTQALKDMAEKMSAFMGGTVEIN